MGSVVPVLVLDTATTSALAGIAEAGVVLAERDEPDARNAAGRVLLAVDAVLAEAAVPRRSLERVIVGVGPGSFTGLRIGIATALGIARGLGVPLAGVSTLAALRRGAAADAVAAIDARRGEIFAEGAGLDRCALRPAALARALAPGTLVVGDGALRYREELEQEGLVVPPTGDPRHRPGTASYLALARFDGGPVEPLYVRAPDAVPAAAVRSGA